MEDEVIYHEKNQIHQYLSSCEEFSGCYDVIKVQRNDNLEVGVGLGLGPILNRHGPTLNIMHYQLDNKTLSRQICKILECGLMLEEDAHCVENIADSCQLSLSQSHQYVGWKRRKLFFLGSAFVASTSMLYYTTSRCLCVSFSMVTAACAVWESYKIIQQQRQVRLIEELLDLLHQLCQLLKKSIQLIQENEILVRGNILARSAGIDFSSLPSHIAKWQLMISLRSCISNTVRQTVILLSNGTRKLIHAIPLANQLHFGQNYLATLDTDPLNLLKMEDDLPLSTLKHNHSIYLLLQSEFLRQLALCFCPKLWLHKSPKQLQDVHSITTIVVSEMSELAANVKREYLAFYSYGLNDKRKSKTLQPSWKYSDVYVATHSAVLHLQAMLLKTRTIEELLEKNSMEVHDEHILDNIENVFEDVLKENDSFESCCKEGIVQLRKLKIVEAKTDSSKLVTTEVESAGLVQEYVTKPEDYVVEDEVFEAMSFENERSSEEHCDIVVLSKEERVRREIERQLSRRMVKELKTVLVSKSTEWKERERRALLKKAGLDPSTVEELSPMTELPCSEGEWPLPRLKTNLPRRQSSSGPSRRRSSVSVYCALACDESDASMPPPLTKLPCSEGEWPLPRLKTGLPRRQSSSGPSRRRSSVSVDRALACDEFDAFMPPPLTELPCSEGEWPLPRLKTGLPRRQSSSGPIRRRSSVSVDRALASDESNASVPPPLPPPPPPQQYLPDGNLPTHEPEAKQMSSELETILKGVEHFWSLRNQFVEDTFSGSGENLLEEFREVPVKTGQDE